MKYIQFIYLAGTLLLFITCSNKTKTEAGVIVDFYTINFEQCMETEKTMMLSEIADSLEYLELKTPKDIVVSRIWDVHLLDDYLFLETTYGIFKFTRQGEFVKKIGQGGQGPGEYSMIFNIDIDPVKKEIILSDSGKLLFYDLDGNYLRSEKWGSLYRIAICDSVLWVSELAHHTNDYIAFALNYKGDTIASMSNPHYGIKSLDEGMGISLSKYIKMFYRHNGSLYLKGKEMNDTIFQLSGGNSMPYAFIDMGEYKLPVEYEAWYSNDDFLKNGYRYWGIPAVSEDDNYLYFFAQRYCSIDGNNYTHNDDNFRYIIYDKEKQKGFVTKDKKEMKITDDILGGPSFWPHWVTDDYYINVIEPHDLLDEVKKGDYTLSPVLERQLAGFDYGTNQLIILGRRKK